MNLLCQHLACSLGEEREGKGHVNKQYPKNWVKIAFLKSDVLNECHNYQTF